MRAVAIVGSPGSGKTTLARALSSRHGLEHIELDGLFHQPQWTPRPHDEFRSEVRARLDAASSGWVVDGNYDSALGGLVQRGADTIVWLDLARPVVMMRVVRRTLRRAVTREELWNGNREPFANLTSWDPEKNLVRWTWVYFERYRTRYEGYAVDGTWDHARVVRLGSPREVTAWSASP